MKQDMHVVHVHTWSSFAILFRFYITPDKNAKANWH
jgi:hypothetical protein